jgi:hypothetical protein
MRTRHRPPQTFVRARAVAPIGSTMPPQNRLEAEMLQMSQENEGVNYRVVAIDNLPGEDRFNL